MNTLPIRLPSPIVIPTPKINMNALKIAIGIIVGIVNVTPIEKLLNMAIIGIADAASNSRASNFRNNGHRVGSTWNKQTHSPISGRHFFSLRYCFSSFLGSLFIWSTIFMSSKESSGSVSRSEIE